ncbi:ABC transporter ATP-binding protein [Anaerobaca lacustris]|uniref:ABC transporter ATP-binding protein n=1 Tax=Anaerobaca lacustris TaxID=3044600 RepID=A0AAW6TYG5_9BACT|nr:ABC transporter ATP-binding protein [Sedimentisphaerales bacterium M17dextr]
MQDESAIRCHQVSKSYRARWFGKNRYVRAVDGISLSVGYGRIIGLIGPNGAGKTTLMNLIAGVLHLDSGNLLVGGHPVGSREAKRSLGYVPEFPAFLENYKVEATLGYHAALCHLSRSRRRRRTGELLDQFGLYDMRTRRCGMLSQGNRQRLALAIACVMQPGILILDEPSNGLDPVGLADLREIIRRLSEQGTAVLISSHRLDELEKLTSDFIGIWNGRAVDVSKSLFGRDGHVLKLNLDRLPPEGLSRVLPHEILSQSGTEVTLRIGSPAEIASVVAQLAAGGVTVRHLQYGDKEESIEDAFLRLSRKRGAGE